MKMLARCDFTLNIANKLVLLNAKKARQLIKANLFLCFPDNGPNRMLAVRHISTQVELIH